MSAHTHTTLVDGCYRCDLNRDEIRDYADTLLVTYNSSVVHDPDCTHLRRRVTASLWIAPNRFPRDRACKHCLPDGLPGVLA